jgi:hypothetical protein
VEIAVHEVLPGGVDVAFDGLGGPRTRECIRALRRGQGPLNCRIFIDQVDGLGRRTKPPSAVQREPTT